MAFCKELDRENWYGTDDVLTMSCRGRTRAGCSNNMHIPKGIKQGI